METASPLYQGVVKVLAVVFRRYFREVSVTGLEHVPPTGGGVLVSWHPNGMIDPGLILTLFPRQVIFGARDGLFRVPGLGFVMRQMGTVPIYRGMDAPNADPTARRAQNEQSLQALAHAVNDGGFACLFPEGDSHDAPHLITLRKGAARLLRQAWWQNPAGEPPPVLLPVGLHYQHKQSWRSKVLVSFHAPLSVPPPPEQGGDVHSWDQRVTALIESSLGDVVHVTDSWEDHHLLHRVRILVRAERASRAQARLGGPDMKERTLGFARAWAAYNLRRRSHPGEITALRHRVSAYVEDLRTLGLRDHELDHAPSVIRRGVAAALVLKLVMMFVLLPPFVLLGAVTHAVPAILLWLASKRYARRKKDISSIKVLLGVLIFPLTWTYIFLFSLWAEQTVFIAPNVLADWPMMAAGAVVILSIVGAIVALRYTELVQDTLRSVRVQLTRSRRRISIAQLRVERGELFDHFMKLTEGIELPGAVDQDGQVRATSLDGSL